ncbi:MAG: PHP domain-containing protein [Acidobacteriota bacterium]|nr:PHP domain-containing protein [Acidobacteriota bacterium]
MELVELAKSLALTAIAVTDHDTVDGVQEAIEAGDKAGIDVIPGLEFSTEYSPGTMHLLGLEIDPHEPKLRQELAKRRRDRDERNPRIAEALRQLGFDITMEEVEATAGGDVIGRPQFGKVMVSKGYVSSVDEAFKKYLNAGRPAYVPQERIAPALAIERITQAGGVAILAHPYQLRPRSPEHLGEIVRNLVDAGLQGIEVHYSKHTPEQIEAYGKLAERYGLARSGGSDFHGSSKPDIQLGTGLGNLRVPPEFLPALRERRDSIRAGVSFRPTPAP